MRYGFIAILAVLSIAGCSHAPSDEVIAAQIKAKFSADPLVAAANLSVRVNKGDVTLSGTASNADAELQAFQLARSTPGVQRLTDQIVAVEPTETPVPQQSEANYVPAPPPPPDEIEAQPVVPVVAEVPVAAPPVIVAAAAPEVVATVKVEEATPPPSVESSKPREHRPHSSVHISIAGPGTLTPLFERWFKEIEPLTAETEYRYRALEPIAAAKQLAAGTIDMAASELLLAGRDLEQSRMLWLPAAIDGVAVVHNIPNITRPLNLSGQLLAAIYSGQVNRWDDPAIRALNPRVFLPNTSIVVVHRSDPAIATFWLTEYLSMISRDWKTPGMTVPWPVGGLGGKGDQGVANLVTHTPDSIGYLEASFARANKLSACTISNQSGEWVKPEMANLSAAASGKAVFPDLRFSLANQPVKGAYPIGGFIWLVMPEHIEQSNKREAIRLFLNWMLAQQGNSLTESMFLAPLPRELIVRERTFINQIR